jgi:hypothetical protein
MIPNFAGISPSFGSTRLKWWTGGPGDLPDLVEDWKMNILHLVIG